MKMKDVIFNKSRDEVIVRYIGRPVEGCMSDGFKPTSFMIKIENNILYVIKLGGSRTPYYEDVLDAILEVTQGYELPKGNTFWKKNGVGIKQLYFKAHRMWINWNKNLAPVADLEEVGIPADIAKRLATELKKEEAAE